MMRGLRTALIVLICLLTCAAVGAQEKPATPAPNAEKKIETPQGQEKAAVNQAGENKAEAEKDDEAQFKESASVKFLAKKLGITVSQAFWISTLLNFAVIAALIFFGMRSSLPKMFRERTSLIQKGIEEARKASAESAAKLKDIESRLSKLDQDIATMKIQAEQDADAEDRRLRAATEEDKKKILQTAEQEITSASNLARNELKKYAAELAVALAEKRITVDEASDKNLVREFATQLVGNPPAKGRS
jgi:F-type H+-transporting ATPase subunit b